MSRRLGVSVVVKNVPGAGARRGSTELYQSSPDGYTIGMIPFPSLVIYEAVGKVGLECSKFVFLGGPMRHPPLIAVSAKSPYRSLEDLKKAEKPVRLAISGPASTSAIFATIAFKEMNIPMTMVTGYRSSAAALTAVLRGDADFLAYQLSLELPHIKSGDLRPLLVFKDKRDPRLPDVPCTQEVGYGQLNGMTIDRPIAAPPGTPKDRAAFLADEIKRAILSKEMRAWAEQTDHPLDYFTPEMGSQLNTEWLKTLNPYLDYLKKVIK
jgi:tripartite-type tricarboxylate transporter receptor subunit TctC